MKTFVRAGIIADPGTLAASTDDAVADYDPPTEVHPDAALTTPAELAEMERILSSLDFSAEC